MDFSPFSGSPGWMKWLFLVMALTVVQAAVMIYLGVRRRGRELAQYRRQAALRQTGTAAQALVVRTRDTGTRLGPISRFVIELQLQVREPGAAAPFDVTTTVPISPLRLADFTEGRTIRVRLDPATREVAVDERTD